MKLFLILLFSTFPFLSHAQQAWGIGSEIGFFHGKFVTEGVAIGGNLSSRSNLLPSGGLNGSLYFQSAKDHFFVIKGGYRTNGYKYILQGFFEEDRAVSRHRFHYLGVSPQYFYRVGQYKKREKLRFYLSGGLFWNYKIHSKWTHANVQTFENAGFKNQDFGLVFGANFLRKISKRKDYIFFFNYHLGLNNLSPSTTPFTKTFLRGTTIGMVVKTNKKKKRKKLR